MLAKRIIPCLDVKNGRNVRGVKFSADKDAGDPIALARRYDREGADELVFYDITASAEKREIVGELVRRVSEEVFIPFTVGGGVRTYRDIRAIIEGGAEKASINSAAIHAPEIITRGAESFGSQAIVGSIDAIRRPSSDHTSEPRWEVVIDGGRTYTGKDALEWAEELVDLGAGGPEDMYAALSKGRASAALAASIFHYHQYSIAEVKTYLAERGVPVRPKIEIDLT